MSAHGLVEHFFRHESGRLVATLSRRVGAQHLDAVEDAVQAALVAALETWTVGGVPDEPSAWLFRVACNHLTGAWRQDDRRRRKLEDHEAGIPFHSPDPPSPLLAGELQDDLLRMLFACCDEAIPLPSQVVLALRTLCGFDVRELSERLFTTEANVYKRLARARDRWRAVPPALDALTSSQYASRLPAVHRILYTLFTEGYLSGHPELAVRRELCDEALRLASVLAEHPVGQDPETAALLALMHLHTARLEARLDDSGALVLLIEQDRSRWDPQHIEVGVSWLARSARGDVYSRYHAEAAIAAEHCLAPSFAATRWDRIVDSYALLEQVTPSPLHALNRAVAVAEWQGAAAGLAILERLDPPPWLAASYQWAAVLADLHGRCGHLEAAREAREVALAAAPSAAVRALLERRFGSRG